MKLKDLKPNKKNPRKISQKKLQALKASVEKYGDLSGFVYNRRTKSLVSGHQRQKSLPEDATIKIEVKHDSPTHAKTVAEGYVQIGSERFKYREVDADEVWEMEALLAANKHGGDWDTDLLRLAIADMPEMNLELAGFDALELKELKIEPIKFQALESEEQSDEEYVAENPGPDSSVAKENIDTVNRENPFEKVEEKKMDVTSRRYVIIIDCKSDEHKKELKEKIEEAVKESGGKFF